MQKDEIMAGIIEDDREGYFRDLEVREEEADYGMDLANDR